MENPAARPSRQILLTGLQHRISLQPSLLTLPLTLWPRQKIILIHREATRNPCHAGSGQFGAVGFSYGGAASEASSDSGSELSDEDDDEADGGEATDALAANLGIDNFCSMQRRAERLEEAERLGKVIKPKYSHSSLGRGMPWCDVDSLFEDARPMKSVTH